MASSTLGQLGDYTYTRDSSLDTPYVFTSKASIEDYITAKAMEYNYPPQRAVAISKAESGITPNAQNDSSTASGLFQFINGTFKGFCIDKYHFASSMAQKNDIKIQIECAVRMLSEGGESHWSESRKSWLRLLNES